MVLSAHAYLGSYSRFIADDYCSGAEAKRFGILRAAWFWYRTWNGRYSANLLDALFGYLGPAVTPAVTTLVLIAWLVSIGGAICFYFASLGLKHRALWSAAVAAAIIFLTLALAPDVPQSLYWAQGMHSVIPPLIMVPCYVICFCVYRSRHSRGAPKILCLALTLVLAYIAGGFSETYTAVQLSALCLALAILLFNRKHASASGDIIFVTFGLLGAALSFITVIAAPGNASRQGFYPVPPPLFEILHISFASFTAFFGHLFDSAPKLLSLFAVIAIGLWAGTLSHAQTRTTSRPFFILALGAVLIFSCFPPAAYGQSDAPPGRTLIIPLYILILTLSLFGISLGTLLATRFKARIPLVCLAVLLVLVVGTISVYQIISERQSYVAYADAWGRFHAQMLGYERSGVARVEISTADMNTNNWSRLNVIGDNPKFWLNKCVSDYYGVSVISDSP